MTSKRPSNSSPRSRRGSAGRPSNGGARLKPKAEAKAGLSCFIIFHRDDKALAQETRKSFEGAGIRVHMYDPENRWKDPTDQMLKHLNGSACVVYVGRRRAESGWVRLEVDTARKLGRPYFRVRNKEQIPSITRQIAK